MEDIQNKPDYKVEVQLTDDKEKASIVSVWQWVGTIILLAIPVVNIILLFVWSFGENVNPNKKSYAQAILLFIVLSVALLLLLGASFFGSMIGLLNQ